MHIVISGGSGFVGRYVTSRFVESGYKVTILTRNRSHYEDRKNIRYVSWLTPEAQPETELKRVDAWVNLAGESIKGIRWTKGKKRRILESRLTATKECIRIMEALDEKPRVFIQGSAIGYYGMSDTEVFTEDSQSIGDDFLSHVVKIWEDEARSLEEMGIRLVIARLGVVLGKEGALPLMALPYRIGIGGTIGSGEQWLSWIHVEDVARIFQWAIENENIRGPLNVTAPEPKRMQEVGQTIGKVLNRPHWLPVPSLLMKLFLGEMSSMLLSGQHVIPQKALDRGYSFLYPTLLIALKNCFDRNSAY